MKRKILLVVLFLILVIFMSGCGSSGVVTPATDEVKVKSVIQDYWFALSNRQYELAKTYCILNGIYYLNVEEYQDISYVGSSTWTFEPYFNYIEITGINAKANINLTSTITVCFGDICSDESETIYNWSMHLTKISGSWKLI